MIILWLLLVLVEGKSRVLPEVVSWSESRVAQRILVSQSGASVSRILVLDLVDFVLFARYEEDNDI